MAKLHETIDHALGELGGQSDIGLGSDAEVPEAAAMESWRQRLLERLGREARVHSKLLLVIFAACFALFAVGLFLLVYHRDSPGNYQLIFGGGSLAGMLAVVTMARRTLIDKAGYDVLLTVVPVLPPEQVVAALKNLHYSQRAKQ